MDEGKESRFESSEIVSMFPTLVWKTQLKAEVHQAIDRSILNTVEEMRRDLEELRPGEAWQSGQELQRLTAFDDLVSCIHDMASVVLRFLGGFSRGVRHNGLLGQRERHGYVTQASQPPQQLLERCVLRSDP
jgi:hypothetical protein